MANELSISAALSFAKGNAIQSQSYATTTYDVTGTRYTSAVVTVTQAAPVAIPVGDVATPGYVLIRNLDTTNFVELRNGSGGADVIKLRPGAVAGKGGFALFELAVAATLFGLADTADCECEVIVIEV